MKRTVFVDTSGWLAIVNKSDELHALALRIKRMLTENKVSLTTTDFVVIEAANSLSRTPLRRLAIELVQFIRDSDDVEVERANPKVLDAAWDLYKSRTDKEWSLTDCASFVVMKRNEIQDAFTNDHHFEQAGFNILLK